jgi:tetratricopeptide (TPR) repeat protein
VSTLKIDWVRPRPEPSLDSPPSTLVREPKAESLRPWLLFVGASEETLARAAAGSIDWALPVISPPASLPLAVAVEALSAPAIEGERVLYTPRIDRGFIDGGLSATSSLYLLPRLSQIASEGAPLTFVATAIEWELERRSPHVLRQRGLASRFEIRRVEEDSERSEISREELSGARELSRPKSLDELRSEVALHPHIPWARYELGKALIQSDDLEGAVAEFRETAALLPEYASAWGNLGAALGELKDFDGAVTALSRAVALDPESAPLRSNLGVVYRDQGKLPEAEQLFREALALDPDFVFGHYNLAHALFLLDRYGEAVATFEKAQSLDRGRAPRQALLLACARLASGDLAGAHRDYRAVFERLSGAARKEHLSVAEWDLKQLSRKMGVTPALKETAGLLRTI